MARPQGRTATNPHLDVLDFTQKLIKSISSSQIDHNLCLSVRNRLLHPQSSISSHSHHGQPADLDRIGTDIWNATSRLTPKDSALVSKFRPIAQAFAASLLDRAYRQSSKKGAIQADRLVRILRTLLKAAQSCIVASEFDVATDILQRAANHVALLSEDGRADQGRVDGAVWSTIQDLIAENWLCRATLSWKQGRLDLTKSHLANLDSRPRLGPTVLEKYAEIAYAISQDLPYVESATNSDHKVGWLKLAAAVLDKISVDQSIFETSALRESVVLALAKAHLEDGSPDSKSLASELLTYLESEYGPKIGVQLLKFDIIASHQPVNAVEYQNVLMQIIRSAILTNNTFKLVCIHVHRLHKYNASLARQSLDAFLIGRLLDKEEAEQMEKALVLRLWTCQSQATDLEVVRGLQDIITQCQQDSGQVIRVSQDASHAALTLAWKCIEACVAAQELEVADSWCQVALNDVFDAAGDFNKAKIARKRMSTALNNGKVSIARETYFVMPASCQQVPPSLYLLYKTAIREGDNDRMQQCLSSLAERGAADPSYLFGCVEEARKFGSRQHALNAMQTILDLPRDGSHTVKQRLTLIRCTVQMKIMDLPANAERIASPMAELCKLFNVVRRLLEHDTAAIDGELSDEISWHAKSTYNLVVKNIAGLDRETSLSLLDHCRFFCQTLATLENQDQGRDVADRIGLCHYLSAIVCLTQAREADEIGERREAYAAVLKHASAYEGPTSMLSGIALSAADTEADRRSEMLRYKVEAIIRLGDWTTLDKAFDSMLEDLEFGDLEQLADLVLVAHAIMVEQRVETSHLERIPIVLQAIINQTWQKDGQDMQRLARWLRCVFRMTMSNAPDTAMRVLEQVGNIVERTGRLLGGHRYPVEEVDWLASTAYNTGVDCYCTSDAEGCRKWATAALNLAQVAADSSGLYAQMQGSWMKLQAQLQ